MDDQRLHQQCQWLHKPAAMSGTTLRSRPNREKYHTTPCSNQLKCTSGRQRLRNENNKDYRAEWARKTCAARRKLVGGVADEKPEKP